MDRFSYQIGVEEDEERLDKWLSAAIPTLSRTYIQKCIKEGQAHVNGKPCKANYRLRVDDEVCFQIPEAVEPSVKAENIPLSVLYEDADVLVIDKPKGMVVHPAPGHYSGTLVNAALYHCKGQLSGINGVLRPGIVHRIDRDTSGLLIFAKDPQTKYDLQDDWNDSIIERKYVAVVEGIPQKEEGTVISWLKDNPVTKFVTSSPTDNGGKKSITHYKVLDTYGTSYSLVEFELETGRKNQIRVHASIMGHPIAGDRKYGARSNPIARLALHAMTISFRHPVTGEPLKFNSGIPVAFKRIKTQRL